MAMRRVFRSARARRAANGEWVPRRFYPMRLKQKPGTPPRRRVEKHSRAVGWAKPYCTGVMASSAQNTLTETILAAVRVDRP